MMVGFFTIEHVDLSRENGDFAVIFWDMEMVCTWSCLCFSKYVIIWYWTDMSAISSCKFCIFWKVCCILSCCSWVLFTKEHVQIEHALQQALPCWITVTHLQGNNTFCAWKRNWNFRHALPEKTAVSWKVFFLRRSFVLKTTLLSAVNCVLYLCENVKIQAHVWKIYCMLCTIAAPFKGDNGL